MDIIHSILLWIRIIELPEGRAVYSGSLEAPAVFGKFVSWFSAYHASLKCELCPRDFMRFNERIIQTLTAMPLTPFTAENARKGTCSR